MSDAYKIRILRKLDAIKKAPPNKTMLHCQFGKVLYDLVPITHTDENTISLIRLLASWRRTNEFWFPVQFPVTLKGTKIWLKDRLLEEPGRLLFMIRVNNQYIGHIGVYRFDFFHKTCEIDNIIRGRNTYPGIMEHAIGEMMKWGKKSLGIKKYTLETTSDNSKALKLYSRLHFTETKRIPLMQVKKDDRIEWQKAPIGYKGTIVRSTVFMEEHHEKI
jgi:RimJ/RimL family protein N-acetyltransferase